ncbi:MAG: hypothetical protein ACQEQ0_07285, partial [Bacteroidota bacterium]
MRTRKYAGWIFLSFFLTSLILHSCNKDEFVYEAQPVDVKVVEANGTFKILGSSVFQLPDTFVWGGSPVMIEDKYYLFF